MYSPGVALPARPRRVKPNSCELKLYVISPGWQWNYCCHFSFQFVIEQRVLFVYGMACAHGVLVCVRYYTHTLSDT